jgi:threonine/homoserine/homoserine lactone efflux protein
LILYFLQGATLALSATIMPGPFQAFLLSQSLKNGWKSTLPAAFAPLVTDGPVIGLVLFVLTQTPAWFLDMLRIAGGLFILYLSREGFLAFRSPAPVLKPSNDAGRRTFLNAVVINALNPNPYIFWSVVGVPIILTGWRESPGFGISFVAGFFGTFVCSLSSLIIIFSTAGRVDNRVTRILMGITALALLVFGLYQVSIGVKDLMRILLS